MRIFIDPGHNGRGIDTGAIGPSGLLECDVTLAVTKLVNAKLQAIGIETKMYRNGDIPYYGGSSNSDLRNRCNVANAWGADYFISIHCNSATPAAHGTETFCYKFGGNGEKLARCIQDRLIHAVGLANRGVKEGNFAVIRDTNMPAVLVELAFISNPQEEKILANPKWHEIMANAIVEGVKDHLGIVQKREVVKVDHWAKKYYDYLKSKGITISETRFDDTVTRGEMFAMLARILGYKE